MSAFTTNGATPTALTLVSDQAVAGAAVASIDFLNVNLEGDNNYILKAYILGNAAGTLLISLNNDVTDANYIRQELGGQLAVAFASVAADRKVGEIPAGNLITMLEIRFKKIAGQFTIIQSSSCISRAGGTPSPDVTFDYLVYKSAVNVTSIKLISNGGAFIDVGSRATLYKVV